MKSARLLLLAPLLLLSPLQVFGKNLLGDSSKVLRLDDAAWRIVINGKEGQDILELQRERDKEIKKLIDGHTFLYFDSASYYTKEHGKPVYEQVAPGFVIPGAADGLYPQLVTVVRVVPAIGGRGQKAESEIAVFDPPPFGTGVTASELDSLPEPKGKQPEIRVRGTGGSVRACVLVNPGGAVTNVSVLSADRPELAAPAEAVMRAQEYSKPMKDGKPVAVWMELDVQFAGE